MLADELFVSGLQNQQFLFGYESCLSAAIVTEAQAIVRFGFLVKTLKFATLCEEMNIKFIDSLSDAGPRWW